MEIWKMAIIWIVCQALAGLAGIWVLNTLFGLELAYELKSWAAVSLGLFLLRPAGILGSLSKQQN